MDWRTPLIHINYTYAFVISLVRDAIRRQDIFRKLYEKSAKKIKQRFKYWHHVYFRTYKTSAKVVPENTQQNLKTWNSWKYNYKRWPLWWKRRTFEITTDTTIGIDGINTMSSTPVLWSISCSLLYLLLVLYFFRFSFGTPLVLELHPGALLKTLRFCCTLAILFALCFQIWLYCLLGSSISLGNLVFYFYRRHHSRDPQLAVVDRRWIVVCGGFE